MSILELISQQCTQRCQLLLSSKPPAPLLCNFSLQLTQQRSLRCYLLF
jgi:hypothetical protein